MTTKRRGSRKSVGRVWEFGIPVKYRRRWPFGPHAAGYQTKDLLGLRHQQFMDIPQPLQ